MERNYKKVLEALQMQPLTEEEKSARHILGRLYGPVATCREGTRNGRKYNRPLWEKTLKDELFLEKVKNKSLFLELGHPTDREETNMEKVCACIPEVPKIVDDDLYTYVDILDTPNGRLLKTLCDYGFVPGISSRGSGDVLPNNEVDPETFFLETWDIVQLPAVKDARLRMCEGFDAKSAKLRQALKESLDGCATEEEKNDMRETLSNLDIDITECDDGACAAGLSPEEAMLEDAKAGAADAQEELPEEEIPAEDDEEAGGVTEEISAITAKDLKDALDGYADELAVEFRPITIEGKEYRAEKLDFDDSEDGILAITIGYSPETGNNIDDEADGAEAPDEPAEEEEEIVSDEAEDPGEDEIIESLKEAVRQKDLLENEVKSLRNDKTVGDAEAKALREELDRYKTAFMRMSKVAAEARKLEADNRQLTERLSQKGNEIESLKKQHSESLNESADKTARQIIRLKEELVAARTERDDAEAKIGELKAECSRKLKESASAAAAYKGKCDDAVSHYLSYRASMLGVKPSEIAGQLNENYSIDDIDAACDEILHEGYGINKLPYGIGKGSKVKINESKAKTPAANDGYEIDDSLLELAGLK